MQYLSQPSQFRASNVHTDVRLVLGWTSSLIAISSALYAYKVGKFQETRPVVLSAVVVFVFLTGVMNLYARFVERDVVFVGRRKVFAGRVSLARRGEAKRRPQGLSGRAIWEHRLTEVVTSCSSFLPWHFYKCCMLRSALSP